MASASVRPNGDEEHHFLYNPRGRAIDVNDNTVPDSAFGFFVTRPLYAPLLFPNVSSDARDHCANERTFLSWLRLSMYLAIVSAAIFINFHLKDQPSPVEKQISHPLGYIFWVLALACLANGFANYVRTIAKYAHRSAIVQYGIKTQVVFGVVATAIIAACGLFIGAEAQQRRNGAH